MGLACWVRQQTLWLARPSQVVSDDVLCTIGASCPSLVSLYAELDGDHVAQRMNRSSSFGCVLTDGELEHP